MRNLIIDYEKLIFRHTTFIKNLYVERLNEKKGKGKYQMRGMVKFESITSENSILNFFFCQNNLYLNEMQDIDELLKH